MGFKKAIIYGALYGVTIFMFASLFFLTPKESDSFPILRVFILVFAGILLTKYLIYMLIAPWHDVIIERKKNFWKKMNPLISIIIPAYNEGSGVIGTVKTILKSKYRNVEVIVVNDGSVDDSDALMKKFLGMPLSLPVRYFYKENGGKGKALNYGIEQARGDIIMTIDADCVVTPDTIGNFAKVFDDPKVMASVGNVKIANTETIVGTVQYLEFLFSFYFKKAESVMGMIYIIGGAAGAFRRGVFEKIGLFDHHIITEDIELTMRIQEAGMKIVYASDAIIYTEGASDINGLMKQRLRWKKGMFETLSKHPELLFSRNPHHNRALSWFLLPLCYFGNVQLALELWFLAFLYVYSIFTSDFSSFFSGVAIVSSMFFVIMAFEGKEQRKLSFFLLSPIAWLLFYLSTIVEVQALARTVWCIMTGKQVTWQRWERKGISLQASN